MTALGPAPSAVSSQSILAVDQHRTALARILTDVVRQPSQMDWEKLHQYVEARLNNLYFRGKQYLALSPVGGLIDLKPANDPAFLAFTAQDSQSANPFLYDYILPIFRGDVLKLASVVGTRAPNLKAAPFIPGRPLEAQVARTANRVLAYLRSHWNLDAFTRQLALTLCNSGTAFSYVNWNVDRDLYGQSEIPGQPETVYVPEHAPYYECLRCGQEASEGDHTEYQGRCPTCEAPLGPETMHTAENSVPVQQPTASIQVDNGAVDLTLGSIFTVDVPFQCKDIDDCPWLRYEYETLKWTLLRRYAQEAPDLVNKITEPIQPSSQTSQVASDMRQALSHPSGTRGMWKNPDLWLSTEVWLTPQMYEAVPKDISGNLRQMLSDTYPDGVRVCYVNSRPVALYHEPLRRHWAACKPSLAETIYGDPIFSDYRQGVDVLNDSLNMIVEALEHMTSEIVYDSDVLDREYLKNNAARSGVWLPTKPGGTGGRALGDYFFRTPGAELKEGVVQFMTFFISQNREGVGITPALFGASSASTAREAEINRNQALQQHVLMLNNMREFTARTCENGLYVLSQRSTGQLYYRSRSTTTAGFEPVPDLALLQQGGYRVWAEETFPMTPGGRRDWIGDMLQNPQSYPIIGLVQDPNFPPVVPQNLAKIHEGLALEDWYVPGLDAYNRLLEIIQELLSGEPFEVPDPMTGEPIMQPSVQPDPVLFEPSFAISVIRGWLYQEDARELEGTPGYANVRAYLEAYLQMQQPPPPPGMGGPQGPMPQPDMGQEGVMPPPAPSERPPEVPIAPEPPPPANLQ